MSLTKQLESNVTGSELNNVQVDEQTRIINVTWGELEVMVIRMLQTVVEPSIEPLIRRVVKEELESAQEMMLTRMKMNTGNKTSTSESRALRLQFQSRIALPLFTGTKIDGDEHKAIEVVLVDSLTGQIVNSGPEAAAKVEIVVLEGDEGRSGGQGGSLTLEEFNKRIVRERKGKPILRGITHLNLTEGSGILGDIYFTHTKDWMNNTKYMLGVRAMDNVFNTIIGPANSEPFILKDRRTKLSEKHYPPCSSDELYRLEHIAKGGPYHTRLIKANINTVKDFLTLLSINPARLQEILGATGKIWKVIVDHARTCSVVKGMYLYHDPNSEEETGVIFDVAGHLMGLVIESKFLPTSELSEVKKANAKKSVMHASEHWNKVVPFDDEHAYSQLNVNAQKSVIAESEKGNYTVLFADGTRSYMQSETTFTSLESPHPASSHCLNLVIKSLERHNPMLPSPSSQVTEPVPNQDNLDLPSSRPLSISTNPSSSCNGQVPTFKTAETMGAQNMDSPSQIPDDFNWEEFLMRLSPENNFQPDTLETGLPCDEQGSSVIVMTTNNVSLCTAQNRWMRVSKLLRRVSIRRRFFGPTEGNVSKRQRRF